MKQQPSALGPVAVEIAREIDQAEATLKAKIAQALEGGDSAEVQP